MSRTGRPRTPTELHVLRGNPGHRQLPTNEPKPRDIPPDKPTWLSREASEVWDRLAPEMERTRLLTLVDGEAFGVYCNAVADYAFLRGVIDAYHAEAGKLTQEQTNEKGHTRAVAIPEIGMAEKCIQVIKAFAIEFGLTPSSRGSLGGRGGVNEKPGSFQDFVDKGRRKKA